MYPSLLFFFFNTYMKSMDLCRKIKLVYSTNIFWNYSLSFLCHLFSFTFWFSFFFYHPPHSGNSRGRNRFCLFRIWIYHLQRVFEIRSRTTWSLLRHPVFARSLIHKYRQFRHILHIWRNTIAFFFLFRKYFSRGERSKGVFDLEVIKNNSCMNLEKYHWGQEEN